MHSLYIDEALRPLPPTLYCNAALTETHIHTQSPTTHIHFPPVFQSCARARGSGTSLFWAFGGQLAKPKGQLAKPKAQLANHPAQTRWHKLGFLTGCPLGCHLGAVSVHFGTILGWGGTWRGPGAPVCRTGAATPGNMLFLLHFGIPLGSLLGPCWDQFSALDPLGRALPHILDHFWA